MQVYVSIGNSDDKLTQEQWSNFCGNVDNRLRDLTNRIYGVWYSEPSSKWQNACWSFELIGSTKYLIDELKALKDHYDQEWIAWHEVGKEVTI